MRRRLLGRETWMALVLALAFATLAWVLRAWGRYPICHNDEVNWIGIAQQLDAGMR